MNPTAADLRAARTWRDAPTAREGWLRFSRWLQRNARKRALEDGDAPFWQSEKDDVSSHVLVTKKNARRLVLFEKQHVMHDFMGATWRLTKQMDTAAATVPFAPFPLDMELIADHARRLRAPLGFIGDADPHGVHVFGALRSGALDAPDMNGRSLKIAWLGIDDRWLRAGRRTNRSLIGRTIQMKWIEREYWFVIKRFMPRIDTLLGEATVTMLDTGTKAEVEGFADVMPREVIDPRGVRAR